MRAHKLVGAVNWKYALGEFVLIVSGILIALWVSDWNQNREDRRAELQLLREMRAALSEDLIDNRTDYDAFKDARLRLVELKADLQHSQPRAPRIDSLFGALVMSRSMQLNDGPYEVLRSRGFDLLSDDSLRSRIVHFYGGTYPHIATRYARVDEFVREYSGPYFLHNFRNADRFGGYVIPRDYDLVARDAYFANLVTWHLSELTLAITRYEAALHEGESLLQALDRQIRHLA